MKHIGHTTYASAPKSHHLEKREGHQECSSLMGASRCLGRTDSEGPGQCMAQIENGSVIERSARSKQTRELFQFACLVVCLDAPSRSSGSLYASRRSFAPTQMRSISSRPAVAVYSESFCLYQLVVGRRVGDVKPSKG